MKPRMHTGITTSYLLLRNRDVNRFDRCEKSSVRNHCGFDSATMAPSTPELDVPPEGHKLRDSLGWFLYDSGSSTLKNERLRGRLGFHRDCLNSLVPVRENPFPSRSVFAPSRSYQSATRSPEPGA